MKAANKGWFKPGYDARRKRGWPRWACRKGFRVTVCRHPYLLDWLMGRHLAQRSARWHQGKYMPHEVPF